MVIKKTTIPRIAFVVHTKELLNHYGPVWDSFNGHPFDILLHDDMSLAEADLDPKWNADIKTTLSVVNAGHIYECLVTNHVMSLNTFGQPGPLIKSLGLVNIRFMYAAGKIRHNLNFWNKYYDGILCFGPYHERAFRSVVSAPVRQMGFPRFDRFFTGNLDRTEIATEFNCDPARKTLVWLPTWRELSSVGYFEEEIANLTHDFNVVVKVHPLMPSSEPEKVAKVKSLPFTKVIDTPDDNLPLYFLADYMLFDYGGPPFAAIYTDKPFILLNVPGAKDDSLTGPKSPDILLRQHFANVEPGSNGIRQALDNAAWWQKHHEFSKRWRNEFFAKNYGSASNVAAQAILHRDWIGK